MIAVDSSVLIDLLGEDARAAAAESAVWEAANRGPVVVCDVVVSEVAAGLGPGSLLLDVLEESGIVYSETEPRAAVRAGEMQRRWRERNPREDGLPAGDRAVPDFLIGAHALLQCQGLITRDAGFFRDYFKGLKVIVPRAAT